MFAQKPSEGKPGNRAAETARAWLRVVADLVQLLVALRLLLK